MTLKVLDLFSGIGGFSLGLERTGGFETVAFCEIEEYPRKILKKHWPNVPIYEDVRNVTAERLAADGINGIRVITAGFPCQDLSVAGRQAGINEGTRSGLWSEVARITSELQPDYTIVENVTALLSGPTEYQGRWFGRVLGDLAEIGYDAEWHSIPAASINAPHHRDRVWIIANPKREGRERLITDDRVFSSAKKTFAFPLHSTINDWSELVGSVAEVRGSDGVPVKLERSRLKACGNSVVPQIPEIIGHAIMQAEGF